MAALVENLFYVSNEANQRFVPWHGLGTSVEEAPTSAEAIKLAGLDWEVDSRPIYDTFGKEIEGWRANTRSTDNSVLGLVSDKYKIVQNYEAFEFTDNLIGDEVKYETAGSLKNGKVIWLLAKMPEKKILDDTFDPFICFTNNHEGKGAVMACMTPIRVVCNNTLNLALGQAKRKWSTKHMGDIKSKLAEAQHTLQLANNYMENLNEEANRLVEVKISDAELERILDDLYPTDANTSNRRKVNIDELKTNIFNCYQMPDISQYKGTAWGVINAVTDFVDHTAPVRSTSTYQEKNWGRIITGHQLVDKVYDKIKVAA